MISIYEQVFVYEMRFVLQYARSTVHRTTRDMVRADEWKRTWETIESTSHAIDQAVREHVDTRMLEAVDNITAKAEKSEALQHATLEAVQASHSEAFNIGIYP